MTEYWLQKKTIGGWSHVTWYNDLAQATENFNRCSAGNSGYSWRVVKAEMVLEALLQDHTEFEPPTLEPLKKTSWGAPIAPKPSQDQKSGWGATPTAAWGETVKIISSSPNTGVSIGDGRGAKPGSVCLMHHSLKKRMRAMPDELNVLLSQGWERGGPRTQFRE